MLLARDHAEEETLTQVQASGVIKLDEEGGSRYTPLGVIGSGGMGTVYLARARGSAGFSRLVAMKRLHPHLAAEKDLVAMLVDEARLTSSISHTNVLGARDLVIDESGFGIVLDYVEGAALNVLCREAAKSNEGVPRPIALALIAGVLRGLDAVHEARGSEGQPLGIVHRDVSPTNILVGLDGVPRIIDFGVAKALGRVNLTKTGEVRGKFSYIAPEQLRCHPVTRQADVYAVGVILWELLTGMRLFRSNEDRNLDTMTGFAGVCSPREIDPTIPRELEDAVMKALAPDLSERYLSAREMLEALAPFERAADDVVGVWVRRFAAEELSKRAALLQSTTFDPSRTADDLVRSVQQSARQAVRQSTRRLTMPDPPRLEPAPEPYFAIAPTIPHSNSVDPRFGAILMFAIASLVLSVGLTVGALQRSHPRQAEPAARSVMASPSADGAVSLRRR